MDSSYRSGAFLLNIEEKCVESYFSTLLHEYIHFLQETCTYNGILYRKALYDNTSIVNKTIINGCNIDCLTSIAGRHSNLIPQIAKLEGLTIIEYGTSILGAKAIKENMAYLAQKYLLNSYDGKGYPKETLKLYKKRTGYNAISLFIESECAFLKDDYLSQFILDDISLMSENPAVTLINLLNIIQQNPNPLNNKNDREKAKYLYKEHFGYSIQQSKVDCQYGIKKYISSILPKEQSTNIDKIATKICGICEENYKKRMSRPSIIAEKLIEYKEKSQNYLSQENDNEEFKIFTEIFFQSFGMPIINKRIDTFLSFNYK